MLSYPIRQTWFLTFHRGVWYYIVFQLHPSIPDQIENLILNSLIIIVYFFQALVWCKSFFPQNILSLMYRWFVSKHLELNVSNLSRLLSLIPNCAIFRHHWAVHFGKVRFWKQKLTFLVCLSFRAQSQIVQWS